MKSRKDHRLAFVSIGAWCLANLAAPVKVLHYGCLAQRDERQGFFHTAAMEWRKAAESVFPNTLAAEYCWRQWERIMRLPRQLAGPVVFSSVVAFPQTPASSTLPEKESSIDQISLPIAA
jgi:hypothetical protein